MVQKNQKNKSDLIKSLIEKKAFWNYDNDGICGESISDLVLIPKTFIYGDVEEIRLMFSIFPKKQIKDAWIKELLFDQRYRKLNQYIALIFFHIHDFNVFVKTVNFISRYEKLKELSSAD